MSDVGRWFEGGGYVGMQKDRKETMTKQAEARAKKAIVPIPDDSTAITEARRRRAAASKTGRESTILTGLGG